LGAVRKEAEAEGRDPNEIIPFYQYDDLPKYGLSAAQLADSREELADNLKMMRDAVAISDIEAVEDHTAEALDVFGINLDTSSPSYPTLGIAVLRAYVRALEVIGKRNEGHPVGTPELPRGPLSTPVSGGGTLREAFDGWNKDRARPNDTVTEYRRAVEMFIQLHGNLVVAEIKRRHALEFRDAIRLVPSRRTGKLRDAPLPELSAGERRIPRSSRSLLAPYPSDENLPSSQGTERSVSSAELADELEFALLANFRGCAESTEARALVSLLAERHPRKASASRKTYARLKTKAGHENAIGAFLGELLAAHGEDCSRSPRAYSKRTPPRPLTLVSGINHLFARGDPGNPWAGRQDHTWASRAPQESTGSFCKSGAPYPKLNNVVPNSVTERLVNNRHQTAIAHSRTTGTLAILSSLFARARRAASEEAESD
jgi:hypothetical protein